MGKGAGPRGFLAPPQGEATPLRSAALLPPWARGALTPGANACTHSHVTSVFRAGRRASPPALPQTAVTWGCGHVPERSHDLRGRNPLLQPLAGRNAGGGGGGRRGRLAAGLLAPVSAAARPRTPFPVGRHNSPARYNDLHVFELQEPTRVITWTGESRVCVAGYDRRSRNEILHLLLPARLSAKENQGLCPDRDFKVEHGGFSDRPVYSLKHVLETSLLVTSGPPDGSLQVWRVEQDETDVIRPLGSIPMAGGDEPTWAKIATASSKPTWVLHGQKVSDVQGTEIESGKTVFRTASTSHDELATLEFLDRATALACSTKGQLFLADVRQPQSLLGAAEDVPAAVALEGGRWCAAVKRGPLEPIGEPPQIARLSSGGCVVLTDPRNMASPLKAATGCVPASSLPGSEFLCVSFAPQLEECLAVSGFDGTVCIYNTQSWGPAPQEGKPLFIHRGHVFSNMESADGPALVTAHTWHPCKPRTLLSAATDGSLHVWDWADPSEAD